MVDQIVGLRPLDSAENFKANAVLVENWLTVNANKIEKTRCLPLDVLDVLRRAGLFRMSMPEVWSGPELDSIQQVAVIEVISRGNAAAGWAAMAGSDSGLFAGYLDEEVATDLFPHLDVIQGGNIYPFGRAEVIDGYYRVSGTWQDKGGSSQADVIAAGCLLYQNGELLRHENGQPQWRVMLAPAEHWQLSGAQDEGLMVGLGASFTTVSKSLLIPEAHSFSVDHPVRQGPMWRFRDAHLQKMSGVPLGITRQIIDRFNALLINESLTSNAHLVSVLAQAELILGQVRAYVFSALENLWQGGRHPQEQMRRDIWLSRIGAFQGAREVSRLLVDAVQDQSIFKDLKAACVTQAPFEAALRETEFLCRYLPAQVSSLSFIGGKMLGEKRMSTWDYLY